MENTTNASVQIRLSTFYKSRAIIFLLIFFFALWRCCPTRAMASSFLRFLDHTQRRNIVGRTPLDECLARRRDLYLTTHNTHNRQTSMPQRDSNPQSQQTISRIPSLYTAWPLGPDRILINRFKLNHNQFCIDTAI